MSIKNIFIVVIPILLISCGPSINITPAITKTNIVIENTTVKLSPTSTQTVPSLPTATYTPIVSPTITPTTSPKPTPPPVKITKENISQLSLQSTLGSKSIFSSIVDVSISPDKRYLTLSGNPMVTMDYEGGKVIHDYGEGYFAEYSQDGAYLAISRPDNSIEIWNISSNLVVQTLRGHENYVLALSWSPVDQLIASYGVDGILNIWNIDSEIPIHQFEIPLNDSFWWDIIMLEWSPDGEYLAIVGIDNILRMFDGKQLMELDAGSEIISDIDWSPDGSFFATSSLDDPHVIIWRTSNLNQVRNLSNHTYWVSNVEWSPNGKYLATADAAGTIFIRDAKNGSILWTITHDYSPEFIHWSYDGTKIAGLFEEMKVYEIESRNMIEVPADIIGGVWLFNWIPDSDEMILLNGNNRVQIWDTNTGETEMIVDPEIGMVMEILYSPEGQRIAVIESGGTLLIMDSKSGKILTEIKYSKNETGDIAWSPDGEKIAVIGCQEDRICLFDVTTGENIIAFGNGMMDGNLDWIAAIDQIISSDNNGDIILWDPETGTKLDLWGNHQGWVSDIEFSPDESYAASIDGRGNLYLWDAASGKRKYYLNPPLENPLIDIAWSPDGTELAILVSGGFGVPETTLHILSSQTLEYLNSLSIDGYVRQMYWSPDGKMLALSNGEIIDPERGAFLHEIASGSFMAWSPDGYYVVNVENVIQLWGINPY